MSASVLAQDTKKWKILIRTIEEATQSHSNDIIEKQYQRGIKARKRKANGETAEQPPALKKYQEFKKMKRKQGELTSDEKNNSSCKRSKYCPEAFASTWQIW